MSAVGKTIFDASKASFAQSMAKAEVAPAWRNQNASFLNRASALSHSFSASVHSLQSSLWKFGEVALREAGAPSQLVRGAGLKQDWHAQQAQTQLQDAHANGLTTNLSEVHDSETLASFLAHGVTQSIPPLITAAAGTMYAARLGFPGVLGAAAGTAGAWYLPALGDVLIHQQAQGKDINLRQAALGGAGLTAAAVALPSVARHWTSSLSGIGVQGSLAQLLGWTSAGSAVAQTQTGLMHWAAHGADAEAALEFKNQIQDSASQGAVFGGVMGAFDPTPSLRLPRLNEVDPSVQLPKVQSLTDAPAVRSSSFGSYGPREKALYGTVLEMPKPRMDETLARVEKNKSAYDLTVGDRPSFANSFLSLLQPTPPTRRTRPVPQKNFATDIKNLERSYARVATPMVDVPGLKAGGLDSYGKAKVILGGTAEDLSALTGIVDEVRFLSRSQHTRINEIEVVIPAGTAESKVFNEYLKSGADPKNILSSLRNGSSARTGLEDLKVDAVSSNWEGQLIRIKLVPDLSVSASGWYDPSQIGQGIVKTNAQAGNVRYVREGVAITARLDPWDRRFGFTLNADSLQSFSSKQLSLIHDVLELEKNNVQKVDVQVPLHSLPQDLIHYFHSDSPRFSMSGSATGFNIRIRDTVWGKALAEELGLKRIKVRVSADPNQVVVSFLK